MAGHVHALRGVATRQNRAHAPFAPPPLPRTIHVPGIDVDASDTSWINFLLRPYCLSNMAGHGAMRFGQLPPGRRKAKAKIGLYRILGVLMAFRRTYVLECYVTHRIAGAYR